MTVYPIKATFARGELSPRLHGRVDIEHYAMGLEECSNFFVLRQGGLRRRPGTKFVAEVKDSSKKVQLIPFEFSATQAYVVELGDQYARFFALDGQVESSGSPYEISHNYLEADLFDVHYAQSADVLYMAHGSYAPQTLTRTAETNWAFADFSFEDGPWQEAIDGAGTLTLSDVGSVVPDMTSNNLPSGTVASTRFGTAGWVAFDRVQGLGPTAAGASGDLSYTFPGSDTKTVDAYFISAAYLDGDETPISWEFEGYDGTSWTILHRVRGEDVFSNNETRYYSITNTTAYRGYRITWTTTGDGTNSTLAEFGLHQLASEQAGITCTASSISGINNGSGFQSADVGRPIRIKGDDGRYRWLKLTAVNSTTEAVVEIHGQALFDTSPITEWQMGAWSDGNGFPKTVGFFEERLVWAGSDAFPRNVWSSKSADFDNYGISDPLVDDDAINITMTSREVNEITFIEESQDLVVGTSGAMRTVSQATTTEAISPSNIQQRKQTEQGAAGIQPVTIENTIIYSDYYRQRLREFNFSFELNGYISPELSILSDHIFKRGIRGMSYQQEPDNLVFVRFADGTLSSTTYEKNQNIIGMVRHSIAGTDAEVEAMAVVSTQDSDRVWMVVKRTINGATKRYVEFLADSFEDDTPEDANFLDSSLTVTGSDFTTVSGLNHLEGEDVGIFADGIDIGDATVSSGSVTLPNGVSADKATVGLRYKSRGKTLRVNQAGNRDGTAMGRKVKVQEISMDLYETGHLTVGAKEGRLFDLLARDTTEKLGSAKALVTGFRSVEAEGGWDDYGQMIFETDRAYPATVRAMVAAVEGEP